MSHKVVDECNAEHARVASGAHARIREAIPGVAIVQTVAPNQLTSAELGKLVEALERIGPAPVCPECDADTSLPDMRDDLEDVWLPRVREAWLSLVRWEADHG